MARSATITDVIRALLSAVLVALLLEASGLVVWAERLEVGAFRDFVQPVTGAWKGLVTEIHLDVPRQAALDLRERWSTVLMPITQDRRVTDVRGVPEVDAVSAAVPAIKQSIESESIISLSSKEWPEKNESLATVPDLQPVATTANTPIQIALVGDSMMAVGLAPVFRRSIAREGSVRLVRAYRSGTGLSRPDVFNWLVQYSQLIGGTRPELVICAIGANDAQNVQIDRTVFHFGTPAWKQLYAERVREFVKLLTREGAQVLWIGMPVMRETRFSRRMASVNELVKEVLAEFPQVLWMDPNPFVADSSGGFKQYRRDQLGRLMRVRADDGIHLSEAGAAFLLPAISNWLQRISAGSEPSDGSR